MPRHLVVGLAGGVVDRGAQQLDVVGDAADPQDLGVPAGHQQGAQVLRQGAGRLPASACGRRRPSQEPDAHVGDEVVDGVRGLPVATARAFAAQTPTIRAPASPGPEVTAMASISSRVHAGLGERVAEGRARRRPGARGRRSRESRRRTGRVRPCEEDTVLVSSFRPADNADAGLVARGLDAEHEWPVVLGVFMARSASLVVCRVGVRWGAEPEPHDQRVTPSR